MIPITEPFDLGARDPGEVFTRLFDQYAPALRGYLAGRVGGHTADDLVAETFLVALRKRGEYDPDRASARAWLYGIATNLLRSHVRQEVRGFRATARAEARLRPVHGHDSDVVDKVDAEAAVRGMAGALARMSQGDRDVLLLTSWAGLEPSEVAEALGIPASTVRSRLHRLRQRLQATFATPEDPGHA